MEADRLEPGAIIAGRYEIAEIVGRGGMGTVYRARDCRLDVTVAVKEMRKRPGDDNDEAASLAQFETEARLLAGLRHPGLPAVTDYFTDADRWYLVMEFIQGITLDQRIRQDTAPVTADDAMRWGAAIAEVLAYLHAQSPPIVFRDVKPANVMLTEDGTVRLIDFGIARRRHEGAGSDTLLFGSPGYSPPEQYGRAQTDARADIYALGATLHHVLTRRDPSATPFRLGPVRSVRPDIPVAIGRLIDRCVALSPDDRPASAAAVLGSIADIRTLLAEAEPLASQPVSTTGARAARELAAADAARRVRGIRTAVGITATAALVVTAGVSWLRRPAGAGSARPAAGETAHSTRRSTGFGSSGPHSTDPDAARTRALAPDDPALPAADSAPSLAVVSGGQPAAVYLDDVQVGSTPWSTSSVAPGRHTIRIAPPPGGPPPWQRVIELRAGDTLAIGPAQPHRSGGEQRAVEVQLAGIAVGHTPGSPEGLAVAGSLAVTHGDGAEVRLAAFLYEDGGAKKLGAREANSTHTNREGQITIERIIRIDGSPAEAPFQMRLPGSELPVDHRPIYVRVVAFVRGAEAARSELLPVTTLQQ